MVNYILQNIILLIYSFIRSGQKQLYLKHQSLQSQQERSEVGKIFVRFNVTLATIGRSVFMVVNSGTQTFLSEPSETLLLPPEIHCNAPSIEFSLVRNLFGCQKVMIPMFSIFDLDRRM